MLALTGNPFAETVQVVYHVIGTTAVPASTVTDVVLANQTRVLNEEYAAAGTGFRFVHVHTTRRNNNTWARSPAANCSRAQGGIADEIMPVLRVGKWVPSARHTPHHTETSCWATPATLVQRLLYQTQILLGVHLRCDTVDPQRLTPAPWLFPFQCTHETCFMHNIPVTASLVST